LLIIDSRPAAIVSISGGMLTDPCQAKLIFNANYNVNPMLQKSQSVNMNQLLRKCLAVNQYVLAQVIVWWVHMQNAMRSRNTSLMSKKGGRWRKTPILRYQSNLR